MSVRRRTLILTRKGDRAGRVLRLSALAEKQPHLFKVPGRNIMTLKR